VQLARALPACEVLWASARQVYDVVLADAAGCHIVTLTPDLLKKVMLIGRSLDWYARETIDGFWRDASGLFGHRYSVSTAPNG
jgi:transaldolase